MRSSAEDGLLRLPKPQISVVVLDGVLALLRLREFVTSIPPCVIVRDVFRLSSMPLQL